MESKKVEYTDAEIRKVIIRGAEVGEMERLVKGYKVAVMWNE